MSQQFWTTKKGEKIKLKDIPNGHIQNILSCIARNTLIYNKELPKIYFAIEKEIGRRKEIYRQNNLTEEENSQ